LDLRYRDYRPDRSAGWTTLIVHGVAEHGGRYDHVSRWLLQRGVRVIVPDLRGHGRSGGVRTDVRTFQDYVDDLVSLRNQLSIDPAKLLVLGHSMGGLIACRYAQMEPRGLGALALSSPLLKLSRRINPAVLALGTICNVVAPTTRFSTKIRHGQMTHDANFIDRRRSDPFLQRSITARWFFRMQTALRLVHEQASRIRVPVKIIQGAADKTVDPHGASELMNVLPGHSNDLQFLPEHLHELLNEADWEVTLKSYFDWAVNELIHKPERRQARPTG
jgi:lysophospholipase